MDLRKLGWQDLFMWRQKSALLYEKNLQIKELLIETFIGLICLYLKDTLAVSISVCAVTFPYRGQQKKIQNNKRHKKSIWS